MILSDHSIRDLLKTKELEITGLSSLIYTIRLCRPLLRVSICYFKILGRHEYFKF